MSKSVIKLITASGTREDMLFALCLHMHLLS